MKLLALTIIIAVIVVAAAIWIFIAYTVLSTPQLPLPLGKIVDCGKYSIIAEKYMSIGSDDQMHYYFHTASPIATPYEVTQSLYDKLELGRAYTHVEYEKKEWSSLSFNSVINNITYTNVVKTNEPADCINCCVVTD